MKRYHTKYQITDKQYDFINQLIKDIGYNDPNLGKKVYSKLFHFDSITAEYASQVIERLLEEKKEVRRPLKSRKRFPYITISDLAAYVFCPVSYAIKETFDITKDPNIEEGLHQHQASMVDELIDEIKESPSSGTQSSLKGLEKEFYKDILSSNIVSRNSDEAQKPFYNRNNTLCGKPDYLFDRKDRKKFIVDERHTFMDDVKVWSSHRVQATGYILGLKELNIHYAYIVYFSWDRETESFDMNPKIFKIIPENKDKNYLNEVYTKTLNLKKGVKIPFNNSSLNFNKCFRCSVRYYCKHKSMKQKYLTVPYN